MSNIAERVENLHNHPDPEEASEMSMISSSPLHSEGENDNSSKAEEDNVKPTTTACPMRQAGQVCICPSCEEERTNMLRRESAASGNSNNTNSAKKRSREEINSAVVVAKKEKSSDEEDAKIAKMADACKTILECIGEDPSREGLVKTPERWAKALLFMNKGYCMSPADVTNGAVFSENHNEMVVVRNIDIHSLCEHHMVPFTGVVHIGYIPNGKILGLSKLARIAELFARRLQVQERLTSQIADAIVETVEPLGVAVVIECSHFCMIMRGVQKTGAVTTTSSVRGCFETNSKTRAEFFSIVQRNGIKMC